MQVLWVDKYRPRSLDKLELHDEVNKRLKKLVETGDFPHVLMYGPSGAGKKTRIVALLRELFGPSVEKVVPRLAARGRAQGRCRLRLTSNPPSGESGCQSLQSETKADRNQHSRQ